MSPFPPQETAVFKEGEVKDALEIRDTLSAVLARFFF